MAAMEATWWLNDQLQAWLGEKNAADTLTQSVPNNVTSEMGLALLDVADVIRPYPEVVAYLLWRARRGLPRGVARAPGRTGGPGRHPGVSSSRYGMRCVGEIKITNWPRWGGPLTPLRPPDPGQRQALRARRGRAALRTGAPSGRGSKQHDVLERLKALPDGEAKAEETERMIDRVRTFIGYREYPKQYPSAATYVYKLALLKEADLPSQAGVLGEPEDSFDPTFQELQDGRPHARRSTTSSSAGARTRSGRTGH